MSIEEGDAKAREFSVMFIETSAKAGFNIKVSMHELSETQLSGQAECSTCTGISRNACMIVGRNAAWWSADMPEHLENFTNCCKAQYSIVMHLHAYLQALFRKIAAALPGMESLSTQKQEDLVDVNLTSNAAQGKGTGQAGAATGCQC